MPERGGCAIVARGRAAWRSRAESGQLYKAVGLFFLGAFVYRYWRSPTEVLLLRYAVAVFTIVVLRAVPAQAGNARCKPPGDTTEEVTP